ncbi:MAG: helix-turn-helix transcriptional regulator [Tissierellaceae bacterium]|nr:helix-turn-helix transcriptional regulator [Tissierellaceae bacterium]
MKFDKGLIGGSTNLLLLSLLQEKDMYGYEIIRELELRSDNSFQLKEGTLYPVLHKLENMGYVESYRAKGDAGRDRKYYQLTKKGNKQLVEEKQQWKVFTQSVEKVVYGDEYEFA